MSSIVITDSSSDEEIRFFSVPKQPKDDDDEVVFCGVRKGPPEILPENINKTKKLIGISRLKGKDVTIQSVRRKSISNKHPDNEIEFLGIQPSTNERPKPIVMTNSSTPRRNRSESNLNININSQKSMNANVTINIEDDVESNKKKVQLTFLGPSSRGRTNSSSVNNLNSRFIPASSSTPKTYQKNNSQTHKNNNTLTNKFGSVEGSKVSLANARLGHTGVSARANTTSTNKPAGTVTSNHGPLKFNNFKIPKVNQKNSLNSKNESLKKPSRENVSSAPLNTTQSTINSKSENIMREPAQTIVHSSLISMKKQTNNNVIKPPPNSSQRVEHGKMPVTPSRVSKDKPLEKSAGHSKTDSQSVKSHKTLCNEIVIESVDKSAKTSKSNYNKDSSNECISKRGDSKKMQEGSSKLHHGGDERSKTNFEKRKNKEKTKASNKRPSSPVPSTSYAVKESSSSSETEENSSEEHSSDSSESTSSSELEESKKLMTKSELDSIFNKFLDNCTRASSKKEVVQLKIKLRRHYNSTTDVLENDDFILTIKEANIRMSNKLLRNPLDLMKKVLNELRKNSPDNEKKIKRLENALKEVNKKIKELEEAEVSSDDEDSDNSYMKLDRYRKRAVQIYEKICELCSVPADAERATLRNVSFLGTTPNDFSRSSSIQGLVNKVSHALEKYYNKSRKFPDFNDVKILLTKLAVEISIKLKPDTLHQLARSIFVEFGNMLQRRRLHDDYRICTEYLDSDEEDPYYADSQLAAKLNANRKLRRKEQDVLDKFCMKQIALKEKCLSDDDDSDSQNSVDTSDDGRNRKKTSRKCFTESERSDSDRDEITVKKANTKKKHKKSKKKDESSDSSLTDEAETVKKSNKKIKKSKRETSSDSEPYSKNRTDKYSKQEHSHGQNDKKRHRSINDDEDTNEKSSKFCKSYESDNNGKTSKPSKRECKENKEDSSSNLNTKSDLTNLKIAATDITTVTADEMEQDSIEIEEDNFSYENASTVIITDEMEVPDEQSPSKNLEENYTAENIIDITESYEDASPVVITDDIDEGESNETFNGPVEGSFNKNSKENNSSENVETSLVDNSKTYENASTVVITNEIDIVEEESTEAFNDPGEGSISKSSEGNNLETTLADNSETYENASTVVITDEIDIAEEESTEALNDPGEASFSKNSEGNNPSEDIETPLINISQTYENSSMIVITDETEVTDVEMTEVFNEHDPGEGSSSKVSEGNGSKNSEISQEINLIEDESVDAERVIELEEPSFNEGIGNIQITSVTTCSESFSQEEGMCRDSKLELVPLQGNLDTTNTIELSDDDELDCVVVSESKTKNLLSDEEMMDLIPIILAKSKQ